MLEEIMRELVSLSIFLQLNGHHLFINLSPHVKQVSIQLHIDGWKEGGPDYSNFFYYDQSNWDIKAKSIVKHIRDFHKEASSV